MQLGWATAGCQFSNEEGVGDSVDSYAYDGKRVQRWNISCKWPRSSALAAPSLKRLSFSRSCVGSKFSCRYRQNREGQVASTCISAIYPMPLVQACHTGKNGREVTSLG